MKIQNLAVIFIIIVLPISMVITVYVQNQIETLELQVSYDFKLKQATADALKAFQLNTVNSSTSDLANSKIRDIEASVNSFYNSMANQFNMVGYNQDILKDYVPAIVYTMYDGYYIYTPFTNKLDPEDDLNSEDYTDAEGEIKQHYYYEGQNLYSLKPYVHYSCRYKEDDKNDVVITYTLDNCITVEGTINGEGVYKTGYLLDNTSGSLTNEDGNITGSMTYRGVTINAEDLKEKVMAYGDLDGNKENGYNLEGNEMNGEYGSDDYYYDKEYGVKYYCYDKGGNDIWFSILTDGLHVQTGGDYSKTGNTSGLEYYYNAQKFTEWVRDELNWVTTEMAVDENGDQIEEFGDKLAIFENDSAGGWADSIEDPNSLFNQHRLAVIRYSIEKNLSIAIANYNNFTGVDANFQMPELKEYEWEQIINNVSIISFMQGLSIGGKIYNGYAIVTNTKTEEVVNTDSIYITTADGYYHRATEMGLENLDITGAYFNVDFERKSITDGTNTSYFYPQEEMGSYSSIVTQSDVNWTDNIYESMATIKGDLASTYFTALGRERFSMFRTNPITDFLY